MTIEIRTIASGASLDKKGMIKAIFNMVNMIKAADIFLLRCVDLSNSIMTKKTVNIKVVNEKLNERILRSSIFNIHMIKVKQQTMRKVG
ncbi:MAG: hypothetical protein RR444_12130 [Oscillospiraceae bacterium]